MTLSGLRLGILGGGQLARMLALAAYELGLRPRIYAQAPDDPALHVCSTSVIGALSDTAKLHIFLDDVDALIVESEFLDCIALAKVLETKRHIAITPNLLALRLWQNKLSQKLFFEAHGIPTTRLVQRPHGVMAFGWLEDLKKNLDKGFVLKWAQGGYDGKGTLIDPEMQRAISFVATADERNQVVYAEEKAPIKRELAMMAVATDSEVLCYPLVESKQTSGICDYVIGPIDVSPHMQDVALRTAQVIAKESGLRGCFGVEFFATTDDQLLVNEVAPRVHNSGHYTMDASPTSQFENHIRAALKLPIGQTIIRQKFAMINLLGAESESSRKISATHLDVFLRMSREHAAQGVASSLHWYDKNEIRPGRKVGHLNITAPSDAKISTQALLAMGLDIGSRWEKMLVAH